METTFTILGLLRVNDTRCFFFYTHSRGQDRIPALMKAFADPLGFTMPQKTEFAPKLTDIERLLVPVVAASGRVKDEPGREIHLRPCQSRQSLQNTTCATRAQVGEVKEETD